MPPGRNARREKAWRGRRSIYIPARHTGRGIPYYRLIA